MSPAKVMLSTKELELVTDAGWILTKNQIIDKVYQLFGILDARYTILLENSTILSEWDIRFQSPKISKGEQYEGLPWVMLDHPRYFTGKDSFAIRSFFWWGNFFSITLQVSGDCQQKFASSIQQYFANANKDNAGAKDWYLAISDDPWQHDFGEKNYKRITDATEIDFAALPFIKLARKIPLKDWEEAGDFFESNYLKILQMLSY